VWGISRIAEELLASHRGLCSMQLVSWLRKAVWPCSDVLVQLFIEMCDAASVVLCSH